MSKSAQAVWGAEPRAGKLGSPTAAQVDSPSLWWDRPWIVALLFVCASSLIHSHLLFFDRILPNDDFYAHYGWAWGFSDAFQAGEYYPRWMSNFNGGLGEPAFLYYPPLFHMFVAAVSLLLGGHWPAMKLAVVVSSALSGLLGYLIGRRLLEPRWAVLVGIMLQLIPLMAMILIRLNGWPWYFALPIVLAMIYCSLFPKASGGGLDLRLTVLTALLVSTHVLSAFMVLLCLPIVQATHAIGRPDPFKNTVRRMFWWGLSAALGVVAASFYLVPALTLLPWITPSGWSTGPWLDWRNSFGLPVLTAILYGVRWNAYQWYMPLVLMAPAMLAALALALGWVRTAVSRRAVISLVAVAGVSVFFATELSYPFWLLSKTLRMVQFPTRFLFITGAAGLIANVICLADIWRSGNRGRRVLAAAAPLALTLAATGFIVAYSFAFLLTPTSKVVRGLTTFQGRPEYKPATLGPNWMAFLSRGGFTRECLSLDLVCRQTLNQPHQKVWAIESPKTVMFRLPLFAFPSWQLAVDGQPVPMVADANTGLVLISLPAGSHEVAVDWANTSREKLGWGISLAAWAMIGGLWLAGRRRED